MTYNVFGGTLNLTQSINPKVAKQHHVGEVGKSITFVLHIISIYSVPNIVEIGQNTYTLQMNRGLFFDSSCICGGY